MPFANERNPTARSEAVLPTMKLASMRPGQKRGPVTDSMTGENSDPAAKRYIPTVPKRNPYRPSFRVLDMQILYHVKKKTEAVPRLVNYRCGGGIG